MSKKSEVVRGFGFAMQLGSMIEAARKKFNVSDDEFHVLGTPEGQEHIDRMISGLKRNFDFCIPAEFFGARPGLYVSYEFTSHIANHAQIFEVEEVPIVPQSFILNESLSNSEIRQKLAVDHIFDGKTEFCPLLADMIRCQPHGEAGALLNNGYSNIFFVRIGAEVFTVYVHLIAGTALWHVHARPFDDNHRSRARDKVFSRN
jgi:hypothetical protein